MIMTRNLAQQVGMISKFKSLLLSFLVCL